MVVDYFLAALYEDLVLLSTFYIGIFHWPYKGGETVDREHVDAAVRYVKVVPVARLSPSGP